MGNSSLLGLLYNVTALFAIATIFDLTTSHWRIGRAWIQQIVLGMVLSVIAVLVMVTPWVYTTGIVFDTRSVVLAISGMFFGLIPTVIVMAVTSVLRIYQGGAAALTGVLVILATGAIGIAWGRLRTRPLAEIRWTELYLFGIVVHVVMLILMLTLPWETAVPVLTAISLPVILIYPMATALLGLLMANRLYREQVVEAVSQREAELRAIIEHMPIPLGMNDVTQRITYLNPQHVETFGYTLEDIPTVNDWWVKAYPDPVYRQQVQDEWAQAVAQAHVHRQPFKVEDRRVTCKDGTVRTIQMNFVALERTDLIIFHDLSERKRAEDVLRASEEQFRTLVEDAPIAIFVQTHGRFAYANEATLRLFGAETAEQLLGRSVIEQFHPDYRKQVVERIRQLNEVHRNVTQLEEVILRLDGNPVTVEVTAAPFVFQQQHGALVFVYDLTARKQVEEALHNSQVLLLKAQQVAHVGSWVWDIAANRVTWSDEMYNIFGIEPHSFTGDLADVITRAIHPDDRAAVEASNRSVAEDKQPIALEYRICRADGSVRTVWAEAGELVLDTAGKPEQLSGIVQDITLRKQDELALRESEARYRDLLDRAPVGIVVHVDLQIQFINAAGAHLLGATSAAELVGRNWREFVHPDRWPQTETRLKRIMAGEPVIYPVEDIYLDLDGTQIDVEVSSMRFDYYGKQAIQTIFTDITQRKRADEQLRLQATALESVANAIVITNRDGQIEWVNPAFSKLTGYSFEEVLGHTPHSVIGSNLQDNAFYQRMWETILAGEVWWGQLINRRKDRTLYPEEQSITPVRNAQGEITHFVAIKQDISLRKRHDLELETMAAMGAALRAATSRAEMQEAVLDQVITLFGVEGAALELVDPVTGDLVTTLARGVWHELTGERIPPGMGLSAVVLSSGEPYLSNDAAGDPRLFRPDSFGDCRAILGVPLLVREQITGLIWIGSERTLTEHDLGLLISIADIAASALYRETLHELMLAQARQMIQVMDSVPEGMVLLDARGRVLLANPLAERMLAIMAPERIDNQIITLGDRPLGELLTSPPKGLRHEVRVGTQIYEVIARPIPSGAEPEQWSLLIDDVTQSRLLQTQMQLQERLATVGQMAAGIAHDFNNIMAVILLYAEMAARTTALPERDRDRLLTIKEQANRATELIRQILDFSRQSVLERQLIDLVPLVKEQVKLLQRTFPESISIRLEMDQTDFAVHADPTRMQQLVMNLAINARDAMPEGGELLIELTSVVIEPGTLRASPDDGGSEWVRLTFADTGNGIPLDVLPHIFDPFFTTKTHGKGTGLGLAQVHGIVAQHDGTIEVASEPDNGTVFRIYLPAALIDSPLPSIVLPKEASSGEGQLVLVVEDNPALRMALTEMLEAMHYTVAVASNGQEALQMFQERGQAIAVVLSDVVMPTLGGLALLHALRSRGWTQPVILMSGHPLETDKAALQGNDVFAWLPKPIIPRHLANALADALSAPTRP